MAAGSTDYHVPFLAALSLQERLDLLAQGRSWVPRPRADPAMDPARLLLWRKTFPDSARFAARLQAVGISEGELHALLAQGVAPFVALVEELGPPPWVAGLKGLLRRRGKTAGGGEPADGQKYPSAAFHPFVAPLVEESERGLRRRLAATFRRSPDLTLRLETVLPPLVAALRLRLCQNVSRTLALVLHLARIQGALPGSTPEERFQAFVAELGRARTREEILRRYPVLARHLIDQARLWQDTTAELAERLLADWRDLAALLEADPQDELTEIRVGEGDRHRGGRSVSILRFASGLQAVYKPRPLAVESRFQELLLWLNARGWEPSFRTLKILDRGSHGWMEHVESFPCSSHAELERYYRRQGAYLALLHALEATDVHAENLIAVGEHPMLIDLESLLHPRFEAGREVEWEMLSRSVLRVGLLPRRIGAGGADLSGLGAAAGQLSPQGVPAWEEPGTDRMRFVRQPRELPIHRNRPALDGRDAGPESFISPIEKGFESMYRLLFQHRTELAGERGFLNRFQEDSVRILLRPTWVYGRFLDDALHPDYLKDALDRERFFDRLWSADWGRTHQARVVEAERHDLLAGDIPYFSSRPASRDLFNSAGGRLTGFFPRCALEEARDTIAGFGERDLSRQLAVIRASLATLPEFDDLAQRTDLRARLPPAAGGDPLLERARAIGERLASLAFERDGRVAWLTLASHGGKHLAAEPAGADLYSGLAGIAFFLAYLGSACGDARFQDLSRKALHRALERVESEASLPIGAFTGLGGIVYALTHCGGLWEDAGLLAAAERYARRAGAGAGTDEALDILGGAAGCIGGLLPLYRLTKSPEVLDAARACGDRLLARAEPQPQGVGWRTPACPKPLAGFAHGNAGYAWALAHLDEATGDSRYGDCARAALEYERSLFSAAEGNWPDLRFPDRTDGDRYMVAWCHGAAGIGLARLTLPVRFQDSAVHDEITVAVKTTLGSGFGRNHSLCHGDLGNIDILQAGQDCQIQAFSDRLCDVLSDSYISGASGGVETPGLFLGISGIGLALLRLRSRQTIPSVLSLEDPPRRKP